MHFLTTVAALALTGTALAAPHQEKRAPGEVVIVGETTVVVHTTTVTVTPGVAQPTPPPAQSPIQKGIEQRPRHSRSRGYGQGRPSAQPQSQPQTEYSAKPQPPKSSVRPQPPPASSPISKPPQAPTSSSGPVSTQPADSPIKSGGCVDSNGQPFPKPSDGSDWYGFIQHYLGVIGMPCLQRSDVLTNQSQTVVHQNNGEMHHILLLPGTGQVLAPGKIDDFENVLVGGWLCELPDETVGKDLCDEKSKGWTYINPETGEVQTGHAKMFLDPSYKEIGCGGEKNQWACMAGTGTGY